jgi:hypothetical protein
MRNVQFNISIRIILGDPCVPNPCLNAGQCQPNGMGGFTCTCLQAYTGQRCEDRKLHEYYMKFDDIISFRY